MPGFTAIGVARTGAEAVACAVSQQADLVLLDFGLPDMTGIQVCHALRTVCTQPPGIIAVTAARDADTVRAAIARRHPVPHIKPYSFAAFRDELDRYAAATSTTCTRRGWSRLPPATAALAAPSTATSGRLMTDRPR